MLLMKDSGHGNGFSMGCLGNRPGRVRERQNSLAGVFPRETLAIGLDFPMMQSLFVFSAVSWSAGVPVRLVERLPSGTPNIGIASTQAAFLFIYILR